MEFRYVGYKQDKKLIWGTIAAASQEAALQILANQGTSNVLSLKKSRQPLSLETMFPSLFRIKPGAVIFFCRQMAMLFESGIDIVTALELLKSQATNRLFSNVLASIISEVRSGSRFSAAIKKYPDVFPPICHRLLTVGERTGGMETVLRQIADYMEKELNARKGVKNAMLYPVVVTVVAVIVVGILVTFVLPAFTNLYRNLSIKLPVQTRLLLDSVDFLHAYGLHILTGLGMIITSTIIYTKTQKGRYIWDSISLKMPLFGRINLLSELARFCRSLALLFKSGLPLTEIMPLLAEGSSNQVMKEALRDVEKGMFAGEGLSRPMSRSALFLPMLVQMVKIGEETGGLDTNLLALAESYETEAQEKTKAVIAMIQPVTTIIIGGVVAFITLSLVQAMYSMYGQMG
ncbi:MAG: type II secretion system F family protein [Dehalococcoidia bacterium]|jgi:type IV pilus assembly protein PilC|nr:MAG: type II secretion system F family protein [Dehalococcoidia bacterium]